MDLEIIMNSNSPKLRWKLVKKSRSYRGTLGRRSANDEAKLGRVGDFSESDSDKFSEGFLGQSGPGKLESVPFKKRRHLLHEDSVSHCPSPSSDGINEQVPHPGGELSARMGDACSDELPAAEDPSLKSKSAAPQCEICFRSNESENICGNLSREGETSERNDSAPVSPSSLKRTEGEISSMAVNREHWDLNTMMDDWVKPFDPIPGSRELDGDMDVGKDTSLNPGGRMSMEKDPKESNENVNLGGGGSTEPLKLEDDKLTVSSAPECTNFASKEPWRSGKPVEATSDFCDEATEDKPYLGNKDEIFHCDSHDVTRDETSDANHPCLNTTAFVSTGNEKSSIGAFDMSQKVSWYTNLDYCERSGTSASTLAQDGESNLAAGGTEKCFPFGQSVGVEYLPKYEDDKQQFRKSNRTGSSRHFIEGTFDYPKQHPNSSQACHIPIHRDNLMANKEGYSSPDENLELRVPYVYSAEEYESVDYGRDGTDGHETHITDCDMSELADGVSESSSSINEINLASKRNPRAKQSDTGPVKRSMMKHRALNNFGDTEIAEKSRQSFDTTLGNNVPERTDLWKGKSHLADGNMEAINERASSISGGKLQPSPGYHQTWRSYSRVKRGIYPGKYIGTRGSYSGVKDGAQRTYWTSRRPHNSRYQLPQAHINDRSMRRDNTSDPVEIIGHGQDFLDSANNCTPEHLQDSIMRRPSFKREDYVGVQRRMPPAMRGVGNFSSIGHYSRHDDRGFAHLHDDTGAFVRFPHSSKRDQNLPLNSSKSSHPNFSRGRSGLRWGSNSPRTEQEFREQRMTRRQSRSPDYRTEARKERMRVPFFKSNFESNMREGHMNTSRDCISSQDIYGPFDDSFSPEDPSTQGKSPIRVFRYPKRFDNMPSPRQFKSNEYYGPSDRFHQTQTKRRFH